VKRNVYGRTEPVGRDEYLYRRIPASAGWYAATELSPRAFNPRADNLNGLSFSRSKYATAEQAAHGSGKSGYYVAVLPVDKMFNDGLTITPRPLPDNPGHVELSDLTYTNRKSDRSREIMTALAQTYTSQVMGPFYGD
jgi:hypothetical protein